MRENKKKEGEIRKKKGKTRKREGNKKKEGKQENKRKQEKGGKKKTTSTGTNKEAARVSTGAKLLGITAAGHGLPAGRLALLVAPHELPRALPFGSLTLLALHSQPRQPLVRRVRPVLLRIRI